MIITTTHPRINNKIIHSGVHKYIVMQIVLNWFAAMHIDYIMFLDNLHIIFNMFIVYMVIYTIVESVVDFKYTDANGVINLIVTG